MPPRVLQQAQVVTIEKVAEIINKHKLPNREEATSRKFAQKKTPAKLSSSYIYANTFSALGHSLLMPSNIHLLYITRANKRVSYNIDMMVDPTETTQEPSTEIEYDVKTSSSNSKIRLPNGKTRCILSQKLLKRYI